MNDQSIEARKFRAQDARQLLENPLLIEAFKSLENALLSAAMLCEPDNKDKAQRIIISHQLLAGIKREITRVIQDGEIAKVQLNEIEAKRQNAFMKVFQR
jgi:hypothetical protein